MRLQRDAVSRGVLLTILVCSVTGTAAAKDLFKPKAKSDAPDAAAAAPSAPASTPGQAAPAYTFKDDTELAEFSTLWQQRQGVLLRMSVLRAYVGEEQTALREINDKMASNYGLDMKKNYTYDSIHKTLVEAPTPPPAPSSAAAEQAPASAPSKTP